MHQYNWIEWLLDGQQATSPIAESYIRLFAYTPKNISDHDALGLILLGGEL